MEIRVAGKGIRSGEKTAWNVDDFEVKISKVEQPSRLTTVEVLCLMEVHQVLVVCEDLDGKRGTMEIMPPGFQGTDDCEDFSVVDIVIALCRDERL